jgi:hypothetical protein
MFCSALIREAPLIPTAESLMIVCTWIDGEIDGTRPEELDITFLSDIVNGNRQSGEARKKNMGVLVTEKNLANSCMIHLRTTCNNCSHFSVLQQ